MRDTYTFYWMTYHDPLYAWMLSRAHNVEEAEDLVARAFARAWEKRGQLRDPEKFKPWLFMIAAHLLNRKPAKMERVTSESLDDPEPEWEDRLKDAENVLDALIAQERGEFFRVTLASLPGFMQNALKLASEGLKYSAIGKRLGIPYGTVQSRIFTARRSLMNAAAQKESYLHAALGTR